MCLLVWSAKVVGICVPDNLNKFLFRKQENRGLSRWLTTSTGNLRLYGSLIGTSHLTQIKQEKLATICRFIVSVYTPIWMEVYFNPAVDIGPQVVIYFQDALLNASKSIDFLKRYRINYTRHLSYTD